MSLGDIPERLLRIVAPLLGDDRHFDHKKDPSQSHHHFRDETEHLAGDAGHELDSHSDHQDEGGRLDEGVVPTCHVVEHQVESDVRHDIVDEAEHNATLLLKHGHSRHHTVHPQRKSNWDVVVECALPVVLQRVADCVD